MKKYLKPQERLVIKNLKVSYDPLPLDFQAPLFCAHFTRTFYGSTFNFELER